MKSAVNEATSSFVAFQREAEQRVLAFDKRRMATDRETNDRREREDREHELVMFRLLASSSPKSGCLGCAACSNPVF